MKTNKTTDNLTIIQDTLMNEISRLADNELMASQGKSEVLRANAISNTSSVYLKTINLKLNALNASSKLDSNVEQIFDAVGIKYE